MNNHHVSPRTSDQPLHLAGDFHEITPYSSLQKDAKTKPEASATRTSSSCPKTQCDFFGFEPRDLQFESTRWLLFWKLGKKLSKKRKEHQNPATWQPLCFPCNLVFLKPNLPGAPRLEAPCNPVCFFSTRTSPSPKRPEKFHPSFWLRTTWPFFSRPFTPWSMLGNPKRQMKGYI